jgi:trehalose 6-phosphate synthase
MRRAARFLIPLISGLALLAIVGYILLTRTTSRWFEKDLELRDRLAVDSARSSLATHWADRAQLPEILADITRDERIMAAAACATNGSLVAATDAYPKQFTCASLQRRMAEEAEAWSMTTELASGAVRVSATRLAHDQRAIGTVVLVHDLSYLERREATTRNFLLVAFLVLALGAAAVTLLAARFAWRGWTTQLRQALAGNPTRDFRPLVRDVRTLVERLAGEREEGVRAGPWGPERLRNALNEHLQGERVVILANREPYIHEKTPDGIRVVHPASGLVTALEPVMRACSGVWVAHGSGDADRETVDARDTVRVPPGEESYAVRRVWLSEAEENGYYYGFSNEGLWPLCHVAGIDDQAVVCRREKIHDQIINDAAVFIEQAGIQRAARGGQFGDVVRQQMTQEVRGICTGDIHGAHVRDVEQAGIAAHGMVLFNLRAIVDGHFPTGEIDHARVGGKVVGIKRGAL